MYYVLVIHSNKLIIMIYDLYIYLYVMNNDDNNMSNQLHFNPHKHLLCYLQFYVSGRDGGIEAKSDRLQIFDLQSICSLI